MTRTLFCLQNWRKLVARPQRMFSLSRMGRRVSSRMNGGRGGGRLAFVGRRHPARAEVGVGSRMLVGGSLGLLRVTFSVSAKVTLFFGFFGTSFQLGLV